MYKRNSLYKEANMGCVRETPQIKSFLFLVTCVFKSLVVWVFFLTTFVVLVHVRVFLFFPFVLCGHFSLCSCSVLFCSILFRVVEGSILSSEWAFFKLFSKLFVLCNCVDLKKKRERKKERHVCRDLLFSFIFCSHFSSMLSVLFCLGCCGASFSLLSAFSQAVCP